MAKNRNKKRNGVATMDTGETIVSDLPQAMDTSETATANPIIGTLSRKIKGRPMKRTKNVRKNKARARAISQSEKSVEKILKNESKTVRTLSAKVLYE